MKNSLLLSVLLAGIPACEAATLVASLHIDTSVDSTAQQSISAAAARTSNGNANTQGAVTGTVNVMSGHQVGTNSYNGINLGTFSGATNFSELNRFASTTAGGLITWDYDLSTYLAEKTIGTTIGDSAFSLDLNFGGRRSGGTIDGLWFISYNGGGISLDTTNITTHAVSGSSSGATNYALVTTPTAYKPVLTLAAGVVTGTTSVDLTADIATI